MKAPRRFEVADDTSDTVHVKRRRMLTARAPPRLEYGDIDRPSIRGSNSTEVRERYSTRSQSGSVQVIKSSISTSS